MDMEMIRPAFEFGFGYVQKLVADIPDEKMTGQPVAGVVMNHGAWTLGHLAWANDNGVKFLGGEPKLTAWKESMGRGSKVVNDRSKYPSKGELLAALEDANGRLWGAVKGASKEVLEGPPPEMMRQMFPTMGAVLAGMMTGHYSSHIGQLSAWRRAMGFGSVY